MAVFIQPLREGPLFFWRGGGGVEKLSHANIFMCCSCCKQCFVCVFQPSPPPVKNYGLSLTNTHCAWLVPSLLGLNICKWSRNGRGRLLYVWHLCVDGQTTGDELATVLIAWITTSLRSKRFQSSYCAKVRAEAKKRLKGEGEGRRGNACPQTLRFWKTPLDISRFGSFVNWQLVKIET